MRRALEIDTIQQDAALPHRAEEQELDPDLKADLADELDFLDDDFVKQQRTILKVQTGKDYQQLRKDAPKYGQRNIPETDVIHDESLDANFFNWPTRKQEAQNPSFNYHEVLQEAVRNGNQIRALYSGQETSKVPNSYNRKMDWFMNESARRSAPEDDPWKPPGFRQRFAHRFGGGGRPRGDDDSDDDDRKFADSDDEYVDP